MGGIIGALFMLVVSVAPFLGARAFASELASTLNKTAGVLRDRARLWYVSFMARKVIGSLLLATLVHVALWVAAVHAAGTASLYLTSTTACAILVELVLAAAQAPAIARTAVGKDGRPLHYPRYFLNDDGNALGRDGRLLTVGGYPVTLSSRGTPVDHRGDPIGRELLVEHPLAGRLQIAEERFRPHRLQVALSVFTVMAAFVANAVAAVYWGAELGSGAVILLGMVNAAIAFIPLKIACELIAATIDLGSKFFELLSHLGAGFILPMVAHRDIGVLPHLDATQLATVTQAIRRTPNVFLGHTLTGFAWVFIVRSTHALGIVAGALLVQVLTDILLRAHGGEWHVQERWRRIAQFQSAIVPFLVAGRLTLDFTPEYEGWDLMKRTLLGYGNWALDFLNGQVGIAIGGWWSIIGRICLGLLFGWGCVAIGESLAKDDAGAVERIFGNALFVAGGLLFLTAAGSSLSLLWKVQGDDEIRLPRLTTRLVPPSAPQQLAWFPWQQMHARLHWLDTADNETGYRVERASAPGSFTAIAELPANSHEWIDTSAQPFVGYQYRVFAMRAEVASEPSNEACVLLDARALPGASSRSSPSEAPRKKRVPPPTPRRVPVTEPQQTAL